MYRGALARQLELKLAWVGCSGVLHVGGRVA